MPGLSDNSASAWAELLSGESGSSRFSAILRVNGYGASLSMSALEFHEVVGHWTLKNIKRRPWFVSVALKDWNGVGKSERIVWWRSKR